MDQERGAGGYSLSLHFERGALEFEKALREGRHGLVEIRLPGSGERIAQGQSASQHETAAKTFSFPIYSSGSHTIASRSASDGMQDGLDLITALSMHPETAPRY